MTAPSPVTTLLQIAGGYCLPRCLHVVADLGVADTLDETPRTAALHDWDDAQAVAILKTPADISILEAE